MGLKFSGNFKPVAGAMKVSEKIPTIIYYGWDVNPITLTSHNNALPGPAIQTVLEIDTPNGVWMDSITNTTHDISTATQTEIVLDTANGPWMLFDNSLGN